MKKRFVISNTPVKFPLQSTILYTFLLYHFQVSGIYWGIFITLYSLLWIIAIIAKWNEERIDLNSDKLDEKKKAVESKFAQRLQKIINERSL
jgi:hypothetical protein